MSLRDSKYFPINTATSCRSKWAWSTLRLNDGTTASCTKASKSVISSDDFDNFHNTEKKVTARRLMLEGKWPGDGCESCENIETSGNFSDRQFQNQIPGIYPAELDTDPTAVKVSPSTLELFFSNTCNFKCLYCNPQFSSSIQEENIKFGGPIIGGSNFEYTNSRYQDLVPKFWKWFRENSQKLQRLQLFGGEPFLQEDVIKIINYLQQTSHPELELNVLTNLSIPTTQLNTILSSLSDSKKNNLLWIFDQDPNSY